MPKHKCYVEPFGGGASVLMQKPRSYAEVYNDKWDVVVNVFRVLRDPIKANKLIRMLELTPFSRTEFMNASISHGSSDIEKARRTILRSFAGFGSASTNGAFLTGFRSNSNRSGTTPAHDWVNYPTHVTTFIERLRGVIIENKNAIEVMKQHDSKQTLFYCDPPYVHKTRNMNRGNSAYAVEMTDEQHRELAAVLHNLTGMVMLSGYHSALYDELYAGWHQIERNALADGAKKRIEVLWFNPTAEKRIPQAGLFR